jgi:hypothetical protein
MVTMSPSPRENEAGDESGILVPSVIIQAYIAAFQRKSSSALTKDMAAPESICKA